MAIYTFVLDFGSTPTGRKYHPKVHNGKGVVTGSTGCWDFNLNVDGLLLLLGPILNILYGLPVKH